MNFPVGQVVSKAPLPIDFEVIFNEFQKRLFNGYVIQSVSGDCIEEGVIFFEKVKL